MSTKLYRTALVLSFLASSQAALADCSGGGAHSGAGSPPPIVHRRGSPVIPGPAIRPSDYISAEQAEQSLDAVGTPRAASSNATQARLTVVPESTPATPTSPSPTSSPGARLTVITDLSPNRTAAAPPEPKAPQPEVIADEAPTPPSDSEKPAHDDPQIAAALRGLVGTWAAVARHGDGELTTVELQLDDRGWAKFTLPDPSGKPSTIERRAELKNDELKLTGPDTEMTLGKLIEVTPRQMVLARADGQITFVRP